MQGSNPQVALIVQPSYAPLALEFSIDQLLTPAFSDTVCRSAVVLLKPNLITATNGWLACTNGEVIFMVARWFVDHGARVRVGDSPAFGSARSVLHKIGVLQRLQGLGAVVTEFHRSVPVVLPTGARVPFAASAMECDYLINLPKVKAHAQMRLTLAVKNYFGCVSGLHKPWWHMVHGGAQGRFADLVAALPAGLPSGYSLVDGVEAMHVTGPIHGRPYPLGLLAGGTNPVAVDTALQIVLGVEARRCPLWCAARDEGRVGTDGAQLLYSHARPDEVAVEGFLVPEELTPVRFNPFRLLQSSLRRVLLCFRDS